MTLDELNRIDVGSPDQVKALQNFLKSRGYYNGAIDGKWGGGTVEGVKSLRTDLQGEAQTKLKTAEAGAETERQKSSWSRFGQEFGPYGVGAVGGAAAGYGMTRKFNATDTKNADEVARLAKATPKTVNPVIAENRLNSINRGRMIRGGTQFAAPAAMLGAAQFTRDVIAPNVDESTRRYVDLAANAEQGAGIGMAGMLAKDVITRSSKIDAVDDAVIRSRAAEARGDPYTISKKTPDTPESPKVDPARMAELRAKRAADLKTEAKAAGLHVSGTKEDLVRRIAEAGQQPTSAKPKGRLPRGKSGLLMPFAMGGLAYDAASSDAEAAGDSAGEAQGKGIAAGLGAAGATAAVPYAISKLPEALGRAANAGGPGFAPSTVDALTDYSPDDLARGRNALARYLPSGLRGGAVEDAYQMAQVPERNPERSPLAAVNDRTASADADFDAELAAFIQAIEEHNSGVGGEEGYGP